jgi:flagellar hook-associated protein 3 FlgL
MLVSNFMHNLGVNMTHLQQLQIQQASGKKYAHISDDPIAAMYAMQARLKLSAVADYRLNVTKASEWNAQAETAVMDLNTILKDAYDSTIDAATDAKTDEDRTLIANKISELRAQALATLNATFADKYVYGAFNTVGYNNGGQHKPPFELDPITGHLLFNSLDLNMRVFSSTGALTEGGVTTGLTTNISDHAALQEALRGADDVNIAFEYGGDGQITVSLGANSVTVSNLGDLANVEFKDRNGNVFFSVDLSAAGSSLPGLGTKLADQITALGSPPDPANPEVTLSVGENGSLYVSKTYDNGVSVVTATATVTKTSDLGGVRLSDGTIIDLSGISGSLSALDFRQEISQLNASKTFNIKFESEPGDPNDPAKDAEIKALFKRLQEDDVLSFDVGPGISMDATINGIDLALINKNGDNIYTLLDRLHRQLTDGTSAKELSATIAELQDAQKHMLAKTAELGGRQNRLEMLESRYSQDYDNYTQMLSNAEDADLAEIVMQSKMAEAIYNAALQTGAQIIQPSLLDYLR